MSTNPAPRRHRIRTSASRRVAALVALTMVVAGCATAGAGVTATRSDANAASSTTTPDTTTPGTTAPGTTTPDTTTPDTTTPDRTTPDATTPATAVTSPASSTVIDEGSSKTPRAYDAFLTAAFADIESFWAAQYPATYGSPFVPLAKGVYAAYRSRREPIPGCGTARTTYADVEGNAFYCDQGDFIVFDDDQLLPQLVDSLGESAVGVVLAHEFGHAIQQRAGETNQPTILREQQADCFAGAWAAHVARGEAAGLTFGDAEIRQGLIAMIQVRDPVGGVSIADPDAHGSGFDRVGAFQDGFNGGTVRCKTFFTEGREKNLIDIPADIGDVNQGNLPVVDPSGADNDIVTLIPADLDRFWTAAMSARGVSFTPPTLLLFPQSGPYPACAGVSKATFAKNVLFCKATNQIMVDQDLATQLDAEPLFGDLSSGYLIGDAYSEAILEATNSTLTGKQRVLLTDCYTGAWVADDIPPLPAERPTNSIRLSAGDLDEAVLTAITRSDATSAVDGRGSAFEKVDAFRTGVLGGLAACAAPAT